MAKVSIGALTMFNHEVQDWLVFKERLEQWFVANDIDAAADKAKCKRRAILLSSLTEGSYKLLRDLALPKVVGTLEYDELVKLLDDHLKSAKCGFAERNRFYSSTQKPTESMAEWAARIRGLAVDCGFSATTLDETLRDRFVLGMTPGHERDKLFTMDMEKLTISKALEVAERIQCARQGAAQASPAASSTLPCPDMPVYKMASVPRSARPGGTGGNFGSGSSTQKPQVVCAACGYEGHEVATCKFSRYKCGKCGLKGHLRRVCPGKKVYRQNYIDGEYGDVDADTGDDVFAV
ncbi:uncharacterized protein LOC134673281 [Cydia fagiglandana]|uniref:uncharacterized protein LOC134666396 n=1 Tax=Cydia fagiglandana TaxID=1458189 RepID=UPI002FEE0CAE